VMGCEGGELWGCYWVLGVVGADGWVVVGWGDSRGSKMGEGWERGEWGGNVGLRAGGGRCCWGQTSERNRWEGRSGGVLGWVWGAGWLGSRDGGWCVMEEMCGL